MNRYAYLEFSDGQTGFTGFQFFLNGSNKHFGWAQITRTDGSNFILHGFGYNSTAGAASHPMDTVEGLSLLVDEVAGDITIVGDADGDVSINFYQILSIGTGGAANALTVNTWNSLEDQDFEGSDAADVNGDGRVDGDDFLEALVARDAAALAGIRNTYLTSAPGKWLGGIGRC